MAVTADKVVVELQAKVDQYNANVARAEGNFTRAMTSIQRGASSMAINVAKGFVAFQASNLVVDATRALIDFSQAALRVTNSLKVAGLEGAELTKVYDQLFASAQKNAVPIESIVQLYSRLALVQNELGVSSDELINFTDNVGLALRVSGKSAQEASGALLQLSQALGSGVVRAEEFNSILEGALPVAQAAAAGLEEAGGSVAKLRTLIIEGKVSSEAFFRAFEAGAPILEQKVAGAALTLDQSFVQLGNSLTDAAGDVDKAYGVTNLLTGAVQGLTGWVNDLGDAFADNAEPIRIFNEILAKTVGYAQALFDIQAIFGKPLGRGSELDISKNVGSTNFGLIPQSDPKLQAALDAYVSSGGAKKTVSLNDFKPPSGSGGGKKSPQDRFGDALQRIKDMTVANELETAAIGRGTEAKTKSLTIEKLINEARDLGLSRTDASVQSLQAVATAYAESVAEMEKFEAEQQRINQGIEDFKSFATDAVKGFIDDIREGKSAAEALGGVFDKLADKLIDIALQNLFTNAFSGGAPGVLNPLGTLIGSLFGKQGFATGTANTGGVRGQPMGIVHGQEAVIPLPSGGKVPVQVMGQGAGGAVMIYLDPSLRGSIMDESASQSIRIVQSMTPPMIGKLAPTATAEAQRNRSRAI